MDAGPLSTFVSALSALVASVAAAEERLRTERRDFAAAQKFVEELNRAQEEETVLLDIGGEDFRVAKAALSREESMLATLVSSLFAPEEDEESGAVFLDRDPTHFPLVLAYLRDPEGLVIPERRAARQALSREARYYLLGGLEGRLRAFWPALVPGDLTFVRDPNRYIVTDGGHTVVTADRLGICAMCELRMTKGRHRWSVAATMWWVIVGIENEDGQKYSLRGPTGQILTPGGFVPHGPPLRPRDVVRVEVDLWEGGGGGTIAFAVNDGPRGVAVPITHPVPFWPFIWLRPMAPGPASCSILSYHRDPED